MTYAQAKRTKQPISLIWKIPKTLNNFAELLDGIL